MRAGVLHTTVLSVLLLLNQCSGFAQVQPNLTLAGLHTIALWSPQHNEQVFIASRNSLTALVLFSPDCPMCINYTRSLNTLQHQLGNKIQVMAVVPGKTYSDSSIVNFARAYQLNFPVYVDRHMNLSRYIKGEVTPEVYLFNPNGQLVYRGAIDNWLVDLGQKKQSADQFYLRNAIDQTLSGQIVSLPYVKAQGCIINDY